MKVKPDSIWSLSLTFVPLLQVAEGTKHLPHLWDLCSNEIVVRSAKHVLKVNSFYPLKLSLSYVLYTVQR